MSKSLFDLSGKTALVTGGNGGIGLGLAEALANAGANVVIWGTNADKNAAAEARLMKTGRSVLSQRVDVADEQQVMEGLAEALKVMGRLDTVIANAGIANAGRPFVDTDAEAFDQVIRVNLQGAFYLFREACKHMVARAEAGDPGGSLIVTSSASAIRGRARSAAYSAAKAAVMGLVRSIAVEHGPHGVRANALIPGWIETDINRHLAERFTREILPRVPIGRWGKPEDFAGLVVYLASDASAFHTGDAFTVDGGFTLS
jgi:NAD(P)-dependent dehydrogenase (short-subunit alcohol dehydrogenase family)